MARILVVLLAGLLVACPGSPREAGEGLSQKATMDPETPPDSHPAASETPERRYPGRPDVFYRRGDGVFRSEVGHLVLRYPRGWTLGIHNTWKEPAREWVDISRFHPRSRQDRNFHLEIDIVATTARNRDMRCARRPEPNTGELLPDVCEFVTLAGHRWLRELYFDEMHIPFTLSTIRRGHAYRLAAWHDGTDEEIDILARILSSVRFRG